MNTKKEEGCLPYRRAEEKKNQTRSQDEKFTTHKHKHLMVKYHLTSHNRYEGKKPGELATWAETRVARVRVRRLTEGAMKSLALSVACLSFFGSNPEGDLSLDQGCSVCIRQPRYTHT